MFFKLRASLLLFLIFPIFLCSSWMHCAHARQITDMAGRKITVPDTIRKVYGASPPATYMIYAMDPGLVAGRNFPFRSSESRYMDPRLQKLPVVGGWFGQGQVANLETLLQVKPDLIIVWRWHKSAMNEKIEKALKPLNIPIAYVVIEKLADYSKVFRFLGEIFQLPKRGAALADYAEKCITETSRITNAIAESKRVSVYYAEGRDGLATECHVSVHAELIPLSGGKNVHQCSDKSTFGMQKVSMEQILRYNPQVIISHEPLFFSMLPNAPKWKNIRAVKDHRVYQIPRVPFNWFDRPPSFMRLLGLKWLTHQLYPQAYPLDEIAETQHFYKLFLNVELDKAAAGKVLTP